MSNLNDVMQKEYMEKLCYKTLNSHPKIKEELKNMSLESSPGYKRQVNSGYNLYHRYLFSRDNMSCATFKATYTNKQSEDTVCIYAYLHVSEIQNYYVAGPTFRSQDGEYRGRFLPMSHFEKICTKYNKQIEIAETLVLEKIAQNKLVLSVDMFNADKTPGRSLQLETPFRQPNIEDKIERLPVKFFALCWLIDYHRILSGDIENHISPAYQYIIYRKKDLPVYNAVVKSSTDSYEKIVNKLIHIKGTKLVTGQKIFQATVNELKDVENINLEIWREIYIGYKCSDLVLNSTTPSFPLMNNWFYIHNAHPGGLFENESQFTKHDQSVVAKKVSDSVCSVDLANYIKSDISGKSRPISFKFKNVSDDLRKGVEYADNYLVLSDKAICVHSEYVGKTLRDFATSPEDVKESQMFHNVDFFKKQLFEFLYTLYCVNTKLGVVHSDMHSNNVTIYKCLSQGKLSKLRNPKHLYVVDSFTKGVQPQAYLLPANGYYSMCIDFSRSIVAHFEMLQREFGPIFTMNFFVNQRENILRTLNRILPDFVKSNELKLKDLIRDNFPVCYKIMTGIDAIMLMRSLLNIVDIEKDLEPSPEVMTFMNKFAKKVEEITLNNFRKALKGKAISKEEVPWVNRILIEEFFDEFKIEKVGVDNTLIDVYSYDGNAGTFSSKDYSKLPDYMSENLRIKLAKENGQELTEDQKIWLRYKCEDI